MEINTGMNTQVIVSNSSFTPDGCIDLLGLALSEGSASVKPSMLLKLLSVYRNDPVGFFSDILHEKLSPSQAEVAKALVEDDRVAVRGGCRSGKSWLSAGIALWYVFTREGATVVVAAPTKQTHNILTIEFNNMLSKSGLPGKCSHSGISIDSDRRILFAHAGRPDSFHGLCSVNMLLIVEDASSIGDEQYKDSIDYVSMHSGTKVILSSMPEEIKFDDPKLGINRTRPMQGRFFEAFFDKSLGYRSFALKNRMLKDAIKHTFRIFGNQPEYWRRVHGSFVFGADPSLDALKPNYNKFPGYYIMTLENHIAMASSLILAEADSVPFEPADRWHEARRLFKNMETDPTLKDSIFDFLDVGCKIDDACRQIEKLNLVKEEIQKDEEEERLRC